MVSQEDKAKMRFESTQRIVELSKEISDAMLFALMLSQYGIRERTVASYLRALEALGKIRVDGHLIIWVGGMKDLIPDEVTQE